MTSEAKDTTTKTFPGAGGRAINFTAGPAGLPLEVMQQAQRELLNWRNTGMGVMEMSHRSKEFISIADNTKSLIRELLKVPKNYKILFSQGGGCTQFASVPLNLMGSRGVADYLVTGNWSKSAADEATKYGRVNIASNSNGNYTTIAARDTWTLTTDASYVHYCANETVHGVEFPSIPDVGIPLVADFSSSFMSQPIDVAKFAMIYAGAQKNIGPAGVVIVIVRDDMLGHETKTCPTMLSLKETSDKDSMYNTPPCFAIYMVGLVLEWIKREGGVEEMARRSVAKSDLLYTTLDASSFYTCPVNPSVRSRMNVRFNLTSGDKAMEKKFVEQATSRGLIGLEGHRVLGGFRASLYNSVSLDDVRILVDFIKEFERANSTAAAPTATTTTTA